MNISENTSDCLTKSHLSSTEKGKLKSQNTSNHLTDPNVSDEFMMTDQLVNKHRESTQSAGNYTLYGYRWLELTLFSFATAMNQVCWISL